MVWSRQGIGQRKCYKRALNGVRTHAYKCRLHLKCNVLDLSTIKAAYDQVGGNRLLFIYRLGFFALLFC